jgi:predicted membrane protein
MLMNTGTPPVAHEMPATLPETASSRMHLPCLAVAILIMLGGSLNPFLMAGPQGQADHGMAFALLIAMTAGMVRGVGFVPVGRIWRWLFSGWTCLLCLIAAAAMRFFA